MSDLIKPDGSVVSDGPKSEADGKISSLWKDIREAIAGSQRDFTQGSIGKAILLLSIPMVLEMSMESIFAVVDIFFVSKLGSDAMTTVGVTESMLTIIYAVSIGLAMATTAMVARRIGEKNKEGASVAAVQAIAVGILVSLPVAALGIFFAPDLLQLMGATESIVESGSIYTSIMLGGNVVIMLLFIINAIFRGAGDAAIAMRVLWLGNVINIILDPCLILGLGPFPELGIKGAAIATNIGRGTAVLFQIYSLLNTKGRVTIAREQIKIQFDVMKRLMRLSLGGIGQFMIATSSYIGLVRIMMLFGSEVVAGYTVAIRIVIFSILPSWGMSNAAATMMGQNLGAKKPERAEKSAWIAGHVNMFFLTCLALVFIVFPEFLIGIFSKDPKLIAVGSQCLRYISFCYPIYAYGMVMVQSFNGAGDTTTPTVINFLCFWLFELPVAYLLAVILGFDARGVYLAITIAAGLFGVVGILLFRRGTWKTREV